MAEASPSQDKRFSLSTGSDITFDTVCKTCESDGDLKEAEGYCLVCREHMCEACLKYHKKQNATKRHTLVDKDYTPSSSTQNTSTVSHIFTQRCQDHSEEFIKYYCQTHKSLGCGDCMLRNHDTCKDKLFIPDEAKNLTENKEFKSFQATIDELAEKSDKLSKSTQSNINSVSDYRTRALNEIETFRQGINDALDKLKATLVEQTEDITARAEAAMASIADQSSKLTTELLRMSSEIKTLLKQNQHCQLFIETKKAEAKLSDLQKQVDDIGSSFVTAFRFKPNEDLQKRANQNDALGELLVKNPAEVTATHVANIKVKAKGNKEKCRILGAALVSRDRLVIADNDNKAIKLIDTCLHRILSEYITEVAPYDVAIVNDHEIAVPLPEAQKILFIRLEETMIPDKDIYVGARCFFIDCILDKLVVSFTGPPAVKILSMAGEVLHTFSSTNTIPKEQLFVKPPRVAVNPFTKTIYASDWSKNAVIMLDMDGNVITQLDDKDLGSPSYSAVDDFGMVYACGAHSNNVLLLSPTCTKVKLLLSEKEGIKGPRSLCFCKHTRRLYVGMDTNTMKVYQLS